MADGSTIITVLPESKGPDAPAPAPDPNRPAWLPEKFKTPEEMAASYKELESKVGKPSDPPKPNTPEAVTEALKAKGLNLAELEADYLTNGGKLSDAALKKITDQGFTEAQAKEYISGQEAKASLASKDVFDSVGGKERFDQLQGFAKANLTPDEVTAYNKAATSGDYAALKLILAGLNTKFEAAYGKDGKMTTGGGAPNTTVDRYKNFQEFRTAQSDPKYSKDRNYQKAVDDKLARSLSNGKFIG